MAAKQGFHSKGDPIGGWDQVYCTDPARYVNIHRAKLRLGLARARLGSRDRARAWG